MSVDLKTGRDRANTCKGELRALVEKWVAEGVDNAGIAAALVETAADAALSFFGPDLAREMFDQVSQSLAVLGTPKGRG